MLWHCWLDGRKGIRPVKINIGCWCSWWWQYDCSFACLIASVVTALHLHHPWLQYNQEWRHSGTGQPRFNWSVAIKDGERSSMRVAKLRMPDWNVGSLQPECYYWDSPYHSVVWGEQPVAQHARAALSEHWIMWRVEGTRWCQQLYLQQQLSNTQGSCTIRKFAASRENSLNFGKV